jgi:cysteine desulfurase
MSRVYLDWNATTPPLPSVVAAMQSAMLEAWGNPSSIHSDGRRAKKLVEDAREAVGAVFGKAGRDVVLTGSATEANNLAMRSAFERRRGVLFTSRIEHASVLKVAEWLERHERAVVEWLPVGADGRVDVAALRSALERHAPSARAEERPLLVAMQAANHETGVVQPIAHALEAARTHGARLHVDAVQAIGKIDIPLSEVDSASVAPHKFRGPKGVGALVTNAFHELSPMMFGGSQERGVRPSTVCGALAAGLHAAIEHARTSPGVYAAKEPLRTRLEERLLAARQGTWIVARASRRVPNVFNVVFPGCSGPELVAALDLEGVSVSSGSACSAGTVSPSGTVTAMHGLEIARGAVRVSMGETTTEEDIERAASAFAKVLAKV